MQVSVPLDVNTSNKTRPDFEVSGMLTCSLVEFGQLERTSHHSLEISESELGEILNNVQSM